MEVILRLRHECVSVSRIYVFASDEAMFQLRGLVQESPNLHKCHVEVFMLESRST